MLLLVARIHTNIPPAIQKGVDFLYFHWKWGSLLTFCVSGGLLCNHKSSHRASYLSQDPSGPHEVEEFRQNTIDSHTQIRHRQVGQEEVGNRSHLSVPQHHEYYQRIAWNRKRGFGEITRIKKITISQSNGSECNIFVQHKEWHLLALDCTSLVVHS